MLKLTIDLGVQIDATLYTDVSATIGFGQRQGLGMLRHIRVQYLWLQERFRNRRKEGSIAMSHSASQADTAQAENHEQATLTSSAVPKLVRLQRALRAVFARSFMYTLAAMEAAKMVFQIGFMFKRTPHLTPRQSPRPLANRPLYLVVGDRTVKCERRPPSPVSELLCEVAESPSKPPPQGVHFSPDSARSR